MSVTEPTLKLTPLYDMHVRLGARMVPFAGYDMPVQYRAGGIIGEHLHTRAAASLFDVSHMGQIALRPHSGRGEHAAPRAGSARPRRYHRSRCSPMRPGAFSTTSWCPISATISCWW